MAGDGEQTRREGRSRERTSPQPADPAADEETRTVDGEAAPAPTRFPIDDWNRYEYVAFIGRGGMGAVFKARDPQLSRFVALKFLMRTDGGRAQRFVAEARAQARVEHEHVCKVYEVATANGVPYIAMQFIDGVTLSQAQDQMTVEDKVHVMRKVADAVHAAHQGGLIHRDLKRSNVMVERSGDRWQPFVLDFGLAREVDAGATVAGEVAGTPAYMSPEQARGERADRRTDVWGLGATLYALLAGKPPNQGTTAEAFASVVTNDVPSIRTVVPQLSGELSTIVMKCLERDPARRYASAAELSDDLRRYLAGEPIAARPKSLVYRASKRLRRSWALAAAIGIAACAVIAVAVVWARAAAQSRLAEKRVQVAQRFGQEVARLETVMRQAYTAPLHDTRREKQQVLDRMAAIAKQATVIGDVATGPAEYAIGRGHLSLHDYANARTHLEAAIHDGYDPPEANYALGLALAALYREGVSEADRIRAIAADLARSKDPDPDILAYESGAFVLAARWAMANKQSPAADFAAAERALARAEQLDASTGFVIGARFDLERWKAEALVDAGRDPANALARARTAVTRAGETDHGSPALHFWLGHLAVVEARGLAKATSPDAIARRTTAAQTARKELAAAVAGNRFYQPRADELLADL